MISGPGPSIVPQLTFASGPGGGAPNVLSNSKNTDVEGLTPEERKEVQDLKKRDAEVRAHEQAHKTVGGPFAGTPSFTTVTGPDGRQYAVAGEVKIDASPVPGNPEATIRKMEVVERAALAPAEPSPEDQQVAQQARMAKLQAQAEKSKQEQEGNSSPAAGSRSVAAELQAFLQAELGGREIENTLSISA